jgi:DNA polymerase
MGVTQLVWERLNWPAANWINLAQLARSAGRASDVDAAFRSIVGTAPRGEHRLASWATVDPRTGHFGPMTQTVRAAMQQRCRNKTENAARCWVMKLASYRTSELDLRNLDRVINARGFFFDPHLAEAVIILERDFARAAQVASGVSARILSSPAKLRALLDESGLVLPNAQRGSLEQALDDPNLADDVRRILLARLSVSGITASKLTTALRRLSADGRLRDALGYYGTQTGRWIGRGFQPQNLPRVARKLAFDDAVDAALARDRERLIGVAHRAGVSVSQVLSSLVRACVHAPPGKVQGIADYVSIEPQVLHWLADDPGIETFRAGLDNYKQMAARIYKVRPDEISDEQRRLGKPLEIGCGYRMGADRFRTYAETFGVDWRSVPFTALELVETWRDAHEAIAGTRTGDNMEGTVIREGGLWRELEGAATYAIRTGPVQAGKCVWEMREADPICHLPSGREMVYADARLEDLPTPWGKQRETMTYDRLGARVAVHGGKLAENITQAVARDILCDAMLRLEADSIRTVLHIHDEVVAELDHAEDLQRMKDIMEQSPEWAEDLPIKVEACASGRYK